MKGKAALIVGLATGYVLGTRDGRERYQQIKTQANRVLNDPRVKEKASQASDLAKEKAPVVKDKVAGATQKATDKVGKKSDKQSDEQSGTSHTGGTGTSASTDSGVDSVDEDVIIVTPPSPSPLAPGPTVTGSQTGGGLDG
jgi:hypothetical protein